MIRLLLACYPARWRARYGEEFAAILEMRPLGPFDVADVLLGALDARLRQRRPAAVGLDATRSGSMSQRIGGWAAIVGGILWLVVFLGSSAGSDEGGGALAWVVLLATSGALLLALVGLSAFQARRYPRLIWASVSIPAFGALVAIIGQSLMVIAGEGGVVLGIEPWYLWFGGFAAMTLGSALFGVATWLVRVLSRAASALLAVGGVLVIPAALGVSEVVGLPGQVVGLAATGLFTSGWIAMGVSALRTRPAAQPA